MRSFLGLVGLIRRVINVETVNEYYSQRKMARFYERHNP
jgi:hypothetical protein